MKEEAIARFDYPDELKGNPYQTNCKPILVEDTWRITGQELNFEKAN